jgi:hypothetical protein
MAKLRGFEFLVNGSVLHVKLTKSCIDECSHQGSCDADVKLWVAELRPYLDKLPAEFVRACLRPFGAWDDTELQDHEENLLRLLWVLANDCKEENTCRTSLDTF